MNAILNLKILLIAFLEHKENILALSIAERVQFANSLIFISDICNAIRVNVQSDKPIFDELARMRGYRQELEDSIALFAKRSFAVSASNVFDVNTGIDAYATKVIAYPEDFFTELLQVAKDYRSFAEACIAV